MNKLLVAFMGSAGGLIVGMLVAALLGPSWSDLAADGDRLERENQELAGRLEEVTNEKHRLELESDARERAVDNIVRFCEGERTALKGEIERLKEKLAEQEAGDEPTECPQHVVSCRCLPLLWG